MYALARFALALAPSALMGVGLVPLLAEPRAVMAAQADDQFKVGGEEEVEGGERDVWGVLLREGGMKPDEIIHTSPSMHTRTDQEGRGLDAELGHGQDHDAGREYSECQL